MFILLLILLFLVGNHQWKAGVLRGWCTVRGACALPWTGRPGGPCKLLGTSDPYSSYTNRLNTIRNDDQRRHVAAAAVAAAAAAAAAAVVAASRDRIQTGSWELPRSNKNRTPAPSNRAAGKDRWIMSWLYPCNVRKVSNYCISRCHRFYNTLFFELTT